MSKLLAITSTDGKVVNQHFGHASQFYIVRVNDGGYEFVEVRDVTPTCASEGHSVERFAAALDVLQDCEAVVTAQIGIGASEYVINHGLRIFECRGLIDDVLQELIANHL